MQIKAEQLNSQLNKKLVPIYLLTGDEPLQLNELADAIRLQARQSGFLMREIVNASANDFTWQNFLTTAYEVSLFSEKKLIDLRLNNTAVGNEGGKILSRYCERPPEDTLLLITCNKLAKDSFKKKWLQAIDQIGIVIQIWELEGETLLTWLQQRALKRGLLIETDGIRLLASRIEGNLLAAAQEIEKLYVLYGATKLSSQQINDVVADSSRYDVFNLIDSLLMAKIKRALKILSALQAEGIAVPVILWAITREARALLKIKTALNQGQQREALFRQYQVWDKRKNLINEALNRLNEKNLQAVLLLSAKADRQTKGQEAGDAWQTLLSICLLFSGIQLLTAS